ncbi:hypothetical protein AB6N35_16845 [Dietzia cinnamea]|uniref:Uncharacterized protein n=1 Tax=Dietzia cinnamea TaxID=321318 RepID=A0ABV3YLW5_9ACTN
MKQNLLFLLLAAVIVGIFFLIYWLIEIPFPWATFAILIGLIVVSWFWYRSEKHRPSSRDRDADR